MPEKMEIVIPDTLDIKASGTKIGEMNRYGNNNSLYIATVNQKVSLVPFMEMVNAYWETQNRKVKEIIIDHDDHGDDKTYFSIYLEPASSIR